MRTFRQTVGLLSLFGLAACTLITDATDRKVVEGELDLNFTFKKMTVHHEATLDVAIVNDAKVLQGRARVILPPQGTGPYPDVTLEMKQALSAGKNKLFFYIDNNDNNLVDSKDNAVDEHVWIVDVPASGTGSFTHTLDFTPFTESSYRSLNASLVLLAPDTKLPAARKCLTDLFSSAVKQDLVVHVTVADANREVAYFKMFAGDPIPDKVTLPGVIDAPNDYKIELFVDGVRKNSVNLSSEDGKDLEIVAGRWFPATAKQIADCVAAQ